MLILTIAQLDITLEFKFFLSFYFGYISACNLVFVFVLVTTSEGYFECMFRWGQVELPPFDPEQ